MLFGTKRQERKIHEIQNVEKFLSELKDQGSSGYLFDAFLSKGERKLLRSEKYAQIYKQILIDAKRHDDEKKEESRRKEDEIYGRWKESPLIDRGEQEKVNGFLNRIRVATAFREKRRNRKRNVEEFLEKLSAKAKDNPFYRFELSNELDKREMKLLKKKRYAVEYDQITTERYRTLNKLVEPEEAILMKGRRVDEIASISGTKKLRSEIEKDIEVFQEYVEKEKRELSPINEKDIDQKITLLFISMYALEDVLDNRIVLGALEDRKWLRKMLSGAVWERQNIKTIIESTRQTLGLEEPPSESEVKWKEGNARQIALGKVFLRFRWSWGRIIDEEIREHETLRDEERRRLYEDPERLRRIAEMDRWKEMERRWNGQTGP
ncbi:MAG: hypothetical protein KGH55_03585 [Nanoarchaeota archaeon]|nr:hypothetical protein [Nanoarchaeota archaeon]